MTVVCCGCDVMSAAAEALKKWDGGRATRGGEGLGMGLATSQL